MHTLQVNRMFTGSLMVCLPFVVTTSHYIIQSRPLSHQCLLVERRNEQGDKDAYRNYRLLTGPLHDCLPSSAPSY